MQALCSVHDDDDNNDDEMAAAAPDQGAVRCRSTFASAVYLPLALRIGFRRI